MGHTASITVACDGLAKSYTLESDEVVTTEELEQIVADGVECLLLWHKRRKERAAAVPLSRR